MTELYSLEKLDKKVNKLKKTKAVGIALPIIALILAIVLCVFVNTDTLKVFKVVGSIISVACAWISLYLLSAKRPSLNEEIARLNAFLKKERKSVECVVTEIDEPKTIADGISAYEIFVDDKHTAFYVDSELGDISLLKGNTVHLEVVDNYIVAYEVIE